jgi:hypothetical protein
MTGFESYIERMEARRKARKEEEINFELLTSLRTRTREEVIADMMQVLTFKNVKSQVKELVF